MTSLMVFITFTEGCARPRHFWIVAGDQKLGESFLDAVCEWSSEVHGEILVYQDGYFDKDKELFDAIKKANSA